MSLVALDGTPLVAIGVPGTNIPATLSAVGAAATLTVTNAAVVFYGYIFTEDGLSHTIDTTGSSSLQWRTGIVTFANAGTTVKVGLAAVDTTNGPPGRASNSAGVITFDVSKSMAGNGGGITSSAWQTHVPDAGTKTIANGDFCAFAIQMTAKGGTDSVIAQAAVASTTPNLPGVTTFDGTSTYAATTRLPNCVIVFSDGALGFFYGGYVASVGTTTQTWNNGSAAVEYGNFLQMPVPAKVYGIIGNCSIGGDTSFVLYSDPLGTPSAQKTVAVDANAIGAAAIGGWLIMLFPAPFVTTASQPLAAIMKPTTGTNISSVYKTFNASAHQKSETLGTNCYAVSRASGAFAAQNSNKDRFAIGVLVGAFDGGVSSHIPALGRGLH